MMYEDESDMPVCPRCGGNGEVECHCGGDLCVCENYGDAPCPFCHGEGEITHKRFEEYMKCQREMHEIMRKVMQETDQ